MLMIQKFTCIWCDMLLLVSSYIDSLCHFKDVINLFMKVSLKPSGIFFEKQSLCSLLFVRFPCVTAGYAFHSLLHCHKCYTIMLSLWRIISVNIYFTYDIIFPLPYSFLNAKLGPLDCKIKGLCWYCENNEVLWTVKSRASPVTGNAVGYCGQWNQGPLLFLETQWGTVDSEIKGLSCYWKRSGVLWTEIMGLSC